MYNYMKGRARRLKVKTSVLNAKLIRPFSVGVLLVVCIII